MDGQIVSIRQRKMASGRISLYLSYRVEGKRYYEYPQLYLLPETGKDKRQAILANKETMRLMEALKAKRTIEIAEGRIGLEKKKENKDRLLTEYLEEFGERKRQTTQNKKYQTLCDATLRCLVAYKGRNVMLKNIDVQYCEGFARHLGSCISAHGKNLSMTTQADYYSIFSALLDKAVRDEILMSNPAKLVDHNIRPTPPESQRVYLDIDEVKKIANCETRYNSVKTAFLFSCFTGLRISDIKRLSWDNINVSTDNDGKKFYRLSVRMQKTQNIVSFSLSSEARKWLPSRNKLQNEVFYDLPAYSTIASQVHLIAKAAGITKNVTFHTARHTFATMMLTLGADIYTVSKLLGHSDIAITQVYAKIIDKKKDDAISLIDKFFK